MTRQRERERLKLHWNRVDIGQRSVDNVSQDQLVSMGSWSKFAHHWGWVALFFGKQS